MTETLSKALVFIYFLALVIIGYEIVDNGIRLLILNFIKPKTYWKIEFKKAILKLASDTILLELTLGIALASMLFLDYKGDKEGISIKLHYTSPIVIGMTNSPRGRFSFQDKIDIF